MSVTRLVVILPFLLLLLFPATCGKVAEEESMRRETPASVHEFAWVSDRIARGGQPDSEQAFRELSEAGIRTIISVDGARPDVETARRHGLRYVHIPFGYDGVPHERQLELAKTVRELEGPFFIHCHHGKHRGPAGAVLAEMSVGDMTPEEAAAELQRAGTDPRYAGLYDCVRAFVVPEDAATRSLAFDFPETAPVPALEEAMAILDRRWDRMGLVQAAGWSAPADHPDVEPAHEALQVRELLAEIGRLDEVLSSPGGFRRWLEESLDAATDLEAALRQSPVDAGAASRAFGTLKSRCSSCHESYRNTPGASGSRRD